MILKAKAGKVQAGHDGDGLKSVAAATCTSIRMGDVLDRRN